MSKTSVKTSRLRSKKFAEQVASSLYEDFDTGNRTTQRRVGPHEMGRAIARHMRVVKENPVLPVYSKVGGGSVAGSYGYRAESDHFEIQTDPGDPLTVLSLTRGNVSGASYSRAISPFSRTSAKQLQGLTLEDIKAVQAAYKISREAGDMMLRGLRKQVRETAKAHEEARKTRRRDARLGRIGTYDIARATCDHCGADCTRRVPVRIDGAVAMVGSSCAKSFPRARAADLIHSLM
jgi:hypothetical protein